MVEPGEIKVVGDGVAFNLNNPKGFFCSDCDQELPVEDMGFYDRDKMSVAIPKDLVDSIDE